MKDLKGNPDNIFHDTDSNFLMENNWKNKRLREHGCKLLTILIYEFVTKARSNRSISSSGSIQVT